MGTGYQRVGIPHTQELFGAGAWEPENLSLVDRFAGIHLNPKAQNQECRMSSKSNVPAQTGSAIPPDDLRRELVVAQPDSKLPHIGVVGDTYTILLAGKDTAGQFCLIDMHVPPGGGPPPHRHDFEETFTVLEGELDATFRGKKYLLRASETINVPANAPHQFHNSSTQPVRLAMHLFAIRAGRIFHGGGSAGGDPHHSATQTRRSWTSGSGRSPRH